MRLRPLLPLALLLPAVPWTQARIDREIGTFRAQEEVLYLWSGEQVKRLSPGFETLAADIYWLRTVQYFGGERLFPGEALRAAPAPRGHRDDARPAARVAYRYGAIFLSEPLPVGAGRPREGVELLEKGVRSLPHAWRLRQDLGFFLHLFLGETERAAAVLNEAAEVPGAAFWLRMLAADLVTKGGSRADARRMWQQMYEQAEEGIMKANAHARLEILDSLDAADNLTGRVAEFEKRRGRRPARLEELREAGLWGGPLADVAGTPYGYDAETGRVFISRESRMWRPD